MNQYIFYFFFSFFILVCSRSFAQEPKLILPIGHVGVVESVCFSPDGRYILSASEDQSAKLWDIKGKLINEFKHSAWVYYAMFSPNGRTFVTASGDSVVRIWDTYSGKIIKELKGHRGIVLSALYSPGGKEIITASEDSTVKIWDIKEGTILSEIRNPFKVSFAKYSPDSKTLLIVPGYAGIYGRSKEYSKNSVVKMYSTSSQEFIEFKCTSEPTAANFSPDGNFVSIATDDDIVRIWDIKKQKISKELKGHSGLIRSISYSADGQFIVTASQDKTIRIWEASTGKLSNLLTGHNTWVYSASISGDQQSVVSSSNDEIRLCKLSDASLLAELKGNALPHSISCDKTGKNILIGSYDNTIKIWDVNDGKFVRILEGHTGLVLSANYSPDGKLIVSASSDSTVRIWDVNSGKQLMVLKHPYAAHFAIFSPDGKFILTACEDGWIYNSDYSSKENIARIWSVSDGKLITKLVGHGAPVLNACFSPDGERVITVSKNGQGKIWNKKGVIINELFEFIESSKGQIRPKYGHSQRINSVQYSPDGRKIVTASADHSIKIWDALSGEFIEQLSGHTDWVTSASFSPDGQFIVSASWDKSIKIWDVRNGKIIKELPGSGTGEYQISAFFSPDGNYIFSNSWDKTIKIWNFHTVGLLYSLVNVYKSDYLVTDQDGLYDGTEGARKLLYYTCGSEVIDLEQFKALSWEPDLVSKKMGVNKEPITAKKLSEINICNFTPEVEEKGFNNGVYQYQITSRTGGVGEIQLYVNGKLVKKYEPETLSKKEKGYLLSFNQKDIQDYFVSGIDNEILVKATTKVGTMTSRGVIIRNSSLTKAKPVPNMYVVSIGISNYKGEKLKLGYASKDAADFAAVVTASAKKLLNADGKEHVNTYTFSTETGSLRWPVKEAIQKTMDSIAKKATADDILIIFFAGHGALQTGQKIFYLVTAEAVSFEQVMTVPKEVAISTDELNEWMRNIKANKQLLILDACNSGQVVQNIQELIVKRDVPADQQRALENLKDITGTYILSASAASQPAYETSLYGQGLLTYGLLSGIKLGEGLKDNKYIDVTKWFNTTKTLVAALAKDIGGRQDPQIMGNASFAVGLVDKEILDGIKLSIKKKIFRRSNLVKEGIIPSDNLGLTILVDKELNEVSARGKGSPLTYASDNTMLDAYSILGRYTVSGNNVSIKVYLMKGIQEENIVKQFEFTGTVDKKEELASKIVQQIELSVKD